MRRFSLIALLAGVLLLPLAAALTLADHNREIDELEATMGREAEAHAGLLAATHTRARSEVLLTAGQPAFQRWVGGRRAANLRDAVAGLEQLTKIHRGVDVAALVDDHGNQHALARAGRPMARAELSDNEADSAYFDQTMNLAAGQVHTSFPFRSEVTNTWVVAVATPVASADGERRAIVLAELGIDAIRDGIVQSDREHHLAVVERVTGRIVFDTRKAPDADGPLGIPGDLRYRDIARAPGPNGKADVGGHIAAFRTLEKAPGDTNDWLLVAVDRHPAPTVVQSALAPLPLGIAVAGLVLVLLGGVGVRAQRRALEHAAETDTLTGLANRRKLVADLRRATADGARSAVLLLFDLNGFKNYNDTFGHLAGDALLHRLGAALKAAVAPYGTAYRLGGDEFCVLASARHRDEVESLAALALTERGEGFCVTGSFGAVTLPEEAGDAQAALRIADQRMYAVKNGGRATAGRQSRDVLLRALAERHPDLGDHLDDVTDLAVAVAGAMGLGGEELEHVEHAAELHDVGKVAIPDAILNKPGPLDDEEWAFMRRHTIIGERIAVAAPALAPVGRLIRASHERWDGSGYPDGLAAEQIPLGARIVAVCDAYDAMTTQRPYNKVKDVEQALAELRRCAGSQFDPAVVGAFEGVMRDRLAEAQREPAWQRAA